jgi:Hypothetical glycosyl hydrolase family 15
MQPPTGGALHPWVPAMMATDWRKTLTPSLAVQLAQRFDLVVGNPGEFDSHVTAMRQANPRLIVLVSINGAYIQAADIGRYSEAQFAHDAAGNRVRQQGPGPYKQGNYLMDVSNGAWVQSRVDTCRAAIAAAGADGCHLGMMGTLPIVKNYNTAPPINPATNKAWTMPDYLRATNAIGAAVQAQLGVPATANGLAGGRGYWRSAAPTSGMLDVYDAAQAEIWMRTAGVAPVTAWPSLAEWKQHVDMLVDLGSKGRVAMVTTKLLTSATPAEQDQWHLFSLASFALGTDGNSWYNFSTATSIAGVAAVSPWDSLAIGEATGPYSPQGSAYIRQFTTGFAAVNPGTAAVTVRLPQAYTDARGNRVSGDYNLAAHSGMIFTT